MILPIELLSKNQIDELQAAMYAPDNEGYLSEFIEYWVADGTESMEKYNSNKSSKNKKVHMEEKIVEPTKKETKMENTKASVVLNANKTAAVNAAKMKAGQVGIAAVTKMVAPSLPTGMGFIAKNPLFEVVVANIAHFAISTQFPGNAKAAILAECMMDASMFNALGKLDIEGKMEELMSKVKLPKALDKIAEDLDMSEE